MPRRSCSGAGKEEGKNAERRCRRKRHGPGLVDDGANRAHEVFSACRGRRAHRSRGCGYLNRNARGLARRNRATPSRRFPWSLPLGRLLAQADHFRTAAIASAIGGFAGVTRPWALTRCSRFDFYECGGSEVRIISAVQVRNADLLNQSHTRSDKFASVLRFRSSQASAPHNDANFGIGTLVQPLLL